MPSKEYDRGARAAYRFLASNPSNDEVRRNYGFSRAAPDQTDFDRAWQKILREAIKDTNHD